MERKERANENSGWQDVDKGEIEGQREEGRMEGGFMTWLCKVSFIRNNGYLSHSRSQGNKIRGRRTIY